MPCFTQAFQRTRTCFWFISQAGIPINGRRIGTFIPLPCSKCTSRQGVYLPLCWLLSHIPCWPHSQTQRSESVVKLAAGSIPYSASPSTQELPPALARIPTMPVTGNLTFCQWHITAWAGLQCCIPGSECLPPTLHMLAAQVVTPVQAVGLYYLH